MWLGLILTTNAKLGYNSMIIYDYIGSEYIIIKQ